MTAPPPSKAPFEQRFWYIWPVAGFIAGASLVMYLTPDATTVSATSARATPTVSEPSWWQQPTAPAPRTYRTTSRPTSSYTYTPPSATVTTPARSFGPGTFLVGQDIEAGTYRATVPAGSSCYWVRMSDTSGELGGIITSDSVSEGSTVVTIAPSDAAFMSKRCGAWTRV